MRFKLGRSCGIGAMSVLLLTLVGADEQKQVLCSDLNSNTAVIGSLGKKLGTYLRISGKVPAQPAMMSNPLAVDHVNGVELASPVLIEIQCDQKFKAGERYQLRGYETGAMVSTPSDPMTPSAPQPQQDYHFAVWFQDVSLSAH